MFAGGEVFGGVEAEEGEGFTGLWVSGRGGGEEVEMGGEEAAFVGVLVCFEGAEVGAEKGGQLADGVVVSLLNSAHPGRARVIALPGRVSIVDLAGGGEEVSVPAVEAEGDPFQGTVEVGFVSLRDFV